MGAGQKPVIKVQLVKKTDKAKKRYVLAAWVRDDGQGLSGKWDKDVHSIRFKDGTVALVEDVWCNVYDERMSEERPPPSSGGGYRGGAPASTGQDGAQGEDDTGDDDIPF